VRFMEGKGKIVKTMGGVFRLCADAVMIAVSFAIAIVLRYMWVVEVENGFHDALSWQYLEYYCRGVGVLLPACVGTFVFLGFYNRGRFYQSRYKILTIFQGVTLGYLIGGFVALYFAEFWGFSRVALVGSYLLSLGLLIGARMWSSIWRLIVNQENNKNIAAVRVARDGLEGPVLVIGGGGYIGSALVGQLLDLGRRVRVVDLMVYGEEPLAPFANDPRLELCRADFRHVDAVVNAMQGVDSVVHLGAIVGDPACALDERLALEINLMATRVIAEVAKGLPINRFIFASTCSVYGNGNGIFDEKSELQPASFYARSKAACEEVLWTTCDAGFQPTVLRFGTVYGLSGRTRFDLVINLMTANALADGKITVSGGEQWRPFIHVEDAARAIVLSLDGPGDLVRGEVFNAGATMHNFMINDIANLVAAEVPTAKRAAVSDDGRPVSYRVDFSKFERALGFRPAWSPADGVREVADSLRDGQVADFRHARHSNAKSLREGTAAGRSIAGEGLFQVIGPDFRRGGKGITGC
jgi:nucleoside-diphosphate-sugar epimerase